MPPPPPGGYQQQGYQQQQSGYKQQGYQQYGYQQNPYQQGFQGMQVALPGAGGILTMGILSIIFCLGLLGIILGIIALSKAGRAISEYNMHPGRYTESSFSRVKSGKVCAIIGLSLSALGIIIIAAANA